MTTMVFKSSAAVLFAVSSQLSTMVGISFAARDNGDPTALSGTAAISQTDYDVTQAIAVTLTIPNLSDKSVYVYADAMSELSVGVVDPDGRQLPEIYGAGHAIPQTYRIRRGNNRLFVKPVMEIPPGKSIALSIPDALGWCREQVREGTYTLIPKAISVIQEAGDLVERPGLASRWWVHPKSVKRVQLCVFNAVRVRLHPKAGAVNCTVTPTRRVYNAEEPMGAELTISNHRPEVVYVQTDQKGCPLARAAVKQYLTKAVIARISLGHVEGLLAKEVRGHKMVYVTKLGPGETLNVTIPDIVRGQENAALTGAGLAILIDEIRVFRDVGALGLETDEQGRTWLNPSLAKASETCKTNLAVFEVRRVEER